MAQDLIQESGVFPVNSNGEVVLQSGTGSDTVVGYINSSQIPTDITTNKMVVKFPSDLKSSVVTAAKPSGDLSGVTDRTNLNTAFTSAQATSGRVLILKGNYIVDVGPTLLSNVHITLEPGTVIKVRDNISVLSTWTISANTVTVVDSTGILPGMHVSDPTANLQANNPFGGIPYATTVQSVSGNVVTLTATPTSSGTATPLTFHPKTNVLKGTEINNFSLTCPGGWATLDGNYTSSYPYNANSDDANRNALQLTSPQDFVIDGIVGANAFYHGAIVVGKISGAKILRYRSLNNGYRGLHFHGEAVTGNTTPESRDNTFQLLDLTGDGHRAFVTRGGDENNSGLFAIFSNSVNTQITSIKARNQYGYGIHMSGGGGAFLPNYPSKYVQITNYISENCGTSMRMSDSLEAVQVGNWISWGSKFTVTGGVFSATAAVPFYCVNSVGGVTSVLTRIVEMPAGSIVGAANRNATINPGMRFFSGGGNGSPTYGLTVLSVSIGTGAGGNDQMTVFNQETGADPYTSAVASTNLYFRGARDGGWEMFSGAGTLVRNIKFGTITLENSGRYGLASDKSYSSTQFRGTDIHFGKVTITGATNLAGYLGSLNHFTFESLHLRNNGYGFETSGISGSYDFNLLNCANFEIRKFAKEHDSATFTNNNAAIQTDSACRNGRIYPMGVKKPSSGATLIIQTVTGATASAAGVSGPITLVDPTASDGTPLTVAGGNITRVDATACIVTRPVDAA